MTSSKHRHAYRKLKMKRKVEFPLFYFSSLPLVICQRLPSREYRLHISGSSADNSLRFTESLCVAFLSSNLQSLVQRLCNSFVCIDANGQLISLFLIYFKKPHFNVTSKMTMGIEIKSASPMQDWVLSRIMCYTDANRCCCGWF